MKNFENFENFENWKKLKFARSPRTDPPSPVTRPLLSPMSIVDSTSPLFWPINTSHEIQTDAKLSSEKKIFPLARAAGGRMSRHNGSFAPWGEASAHTALYPVSASPRPMVGLARNRRNTNSLLCQARRKQDFYFCEEQLAKRAFVRKKGQRCSAKNTFWASRRVVLKRLMFFPLFSCGDVLL